MANYSNDKDGFLHVRDENNVIVFDRPSSTVKAGWSKLPFVASRTTVTDENTGRHTTKV